MAVRAILLKPQLTHVTPVLKILLWFTVPCRKSEALSKSPTPSACFSPPSPRRASDPVLLPSSPSHSVPGYWPGHLTILTSGPLHVFSLPAILFLRLPLRLSLFLVPNLYLNIIFCGSRHKPNDNRQRLLIQSLP